MYIQDPLITSPNEMIEKKNEEPSEKSAQNYRDIFKNFPEQPFHQLKMINEHHLLSNQTVKRVVNITIEASENNVCFFPWIIPLINPESHAFGINIEGNEKYRKYELTSKKESYDYLKLNEEQDKELRFYFLKILFKNLKKGEICDLKIEYFISNAFGFNSSSLLYEKSSYFFAHNFVSDTYIYEMRIISNKNIRYKIKQTDLEFDEVEIDNKRILFSKTKPKGRENQNPIERRVNSSLQGRLDLKIKRDNYSAISTSIIAMLATGTYNILRKLDAQLGDYSILIYPVITLIFIYTIFNVLKE